MFFFFFEQEAVDIINQSLSGEETLEVGAISRDFGYDYILPKGCQQLGFPPRTAIEVKKKLKTSGLEMKFPSCMFME